MQLAIDCATQHIREFLAQATNGEQADMGKVCGDNCQIWREGRCKSFNRLGNLDPITSQSDVKISMSPRVVNENSDLQDVAASPV